MTTAACIKVGENESVARALIKAQRTHKNPFCYLIAYHIYQSQQYYGKALKYAKRFRKSLDALEPAVDTVLKVEMLKGEVDYRIGWLESVCL